MNTRLLDTSYQLELLRSLLQGLPCIFVVRLVGAILLHAAAAASTRARLRPCGPHGRPLARAGPQYLLQTLEPRFNLATVLGRSLSSSSVSAMLMVVVIDEVVGGGDGAGNRDVMCPTPSLNPNPCARPNAQPTGRPSGRRRRQRPPPRPLPTLEAPKQWTLKKNSRHKTIHTAFSTTTTYLHKYQTLMQLHILFRIAISAPNPVKKIKRKLK